MTADRGRVIPLPPFGPGDHRHTAARPVRRRCKYRLTAPTETRQSIAVCRSDGRLATVSRTDVQTMLSPRETAVRQGGRGGTDDTHPSLDRESPVTAVGSRVIPLPSGGSRATAVTTYVNQYHSHHVLRFEYDT